MKIRLDLVEASFARAKREHIASAITKLFDEGEVRKAKPRQIEGRRRELLTRYPDDPEVANRQLERILKGNDLTDINYLARGLACARAVGRVVILRGKQLEGYGTGFLIAPGVLMTNEHVLESAQLVESSLVEFEYERDANGTEKTPARFRLSGRPDPIISKELDFTLAAVSALSDRSRRLEEFGWLHLNPQPGKAFVGEYLTIIQHPGGEPKQICVRENKLIKYDENGPYLWYETDTAGGSSGSSVFNTDWEVVAIHHSAIPNTRKVKGRDVWIARNGEPWTSSMGDDQIDWIANEGVRISSILAYLRDEHGNHPLARGPGCPALPS